MYSTIFVVILVARGQFILTHVVDHRVQTLMVCCYNVIMLVTGGSLCGFYVPAAQSFLGIISVTVCCCR